MFEYTPSDLFSIELEKPIVLKDQSIKSGTRKARIDILLMLGSVNEFIICAIELKYFKRKNQREPNNRYDVFRDISNLEKYLKLGIDEAYMLIATDHPHYVKQEKYSPDTSDFDFRHARKYVANTELRYNTEKPYGQPIKLEKNYSFLWDTLHERFSMDSEQYSLLLPINS